jgi:O-methyltransferase domain/Dimerisation domain
MAGTTPVTPRKVPPVPPRLVLTLVTGLRNFLNGLVRRTVPAPVAMLEIILGFFTVPMVRAAAKLDIAEHLAGGPLTAEELARATGTNPAALARLMNTLVSMGIFTRGDDARYRLNALGQTLRADVPGSMRDLVMFIFDPWHVNAWGAFPETVRTGKNGVELVHGKGLFDLLDGTEEGRTFDGAMVSLTQLDAPAHARGYDFSSVRQVCDVAGGKGTLLAHVLAQHPHLQGILFDQPNVVAGARPLLESWGVADRVKLVGGSFFESVPEGCDVYMMRDILHDWDDARSVAILKTIRKAMTPASRLLVDEMVMTEDNAPFPGKVYDIEMMAVTSEGKQRTPAQFRALFEQAGMTFSRIIPTSSPFSLVEAFPAGRA